MTSHMPPQGLALLQAGRVSGLLCSAEYIGQAETATGLASLAPILAGPGRGMVRQGRPKEEPNAGSEGSPGRWEQPAYNL